jgi:hypothetical protein
MDFKKLYAQAKKLGIDDEELHILVEGITKKSSLKQLTPYQLQMCENELEKRLNIKKPKKATKEIVSVIFAIAHKICEYPQHKGQTYIQVAVAVSKQALKTHGFIDFNNLTQEQAERIAERLNWMLNVLKSQT